VQSLSTVIVPTLNHFQPGFAESTALAVGIVIVFLTINSYVNKKPNSVQEETSDIQSSFPDIHQIMK
jgi:hypothetical protein